MDDRSKATENQVQKHKDAIAAGLAAAWSVSHVVRAWGDTAPSSLWSKQQTTDWVRTHVTFNNTALSSALTGVWAEGFVLGNDLAEHAFSVAGGIDDSVRILADFNWDNWTPGNRPAAVIANPTGGFADRLAQRGVTLKGLDETTTNRIGTILTNGLAEGLTPHAVSTDVAGELIDSRTNWAATLEERLTQINQDARRAETIARTEMNQAVADEVVNRYDALGVTQVEWNVIDPCDICDINDGEVRDLGDEFPSGDSQPTVHPNCNCFLTPVIDTGDDVTDKFLQAWSLKFNENHDENGRFAPSDSAGGSLATASKTPPNFPENSRTIYRGLVLGGSYGQDITLDDLAARITQGSAGLGKWWSDSPSVGEQNATGDHPLNNVWSLHDPTEPVYGVMLQANLNSDAKPVSSEDSIFTYSPERVMSSPNPSNIESLTGHFYRRDTDGSRTYVGSMKIPVSNATKALKPELENKIPPTIGVPGSLEMEQALSRLDILPNPTDPTIKNPIKYVETPWEVIKVPTIDPNIWDNARIRVIKIGDLFGTDPYLKRKRVRHHIESMGQALMPYRSYAMVLEHEGDPLIIDGHHRLMSLWLLGLNEAPVWYVKG